MATDQIERGISTTLDGIEQIGRNGGYREKVEALEVLNEMTWFDNFGAPLYRRRLQIADRIAADVKDDDVPEFLAEELDGY